VKRPVRIPETVPLGEVKPAELHAGESCTMELAVPLPCRVDGGTTLSLFSFHRRWMKHTFVIQSAYPEREGYVTASCDGRNLAGVETDRAFEATFRVPPKGLPAGEILRFTVGDTSGGSPGARCSTITNSQAFCTVKLGHERYPREFSPHEIPCLCAFVFSVTGATMETARLYTPSQALRGKPFSVTLRPQDRYGNASARNESARFLLRWEANTREIHVDHGTRNQAGTIEIPDISFEAAGIHTLRASCPARNIDVFSNPVEIRAAPRPRNLYWGLIHEHTEMSDGTGTLQDCYRNMKSGSRFDFGAVTDHDHAFETTDDMWRRACTAAEKFHEPGRFVTFPGYEWAKWRRNGDGDRNVYYRKDHPSMYRSETGQYDTPPKLFEALEREEALVIPHHTAHAGNFCDWKDHDPGKERLVEIYSVWGNSENAAQDGNPFPVRTPLGETTETETGFVRNALKHGWKVGFTAGGDMHYAHPGDDVRKGAPPTDYKAGITGIWAEGLTRESLWEAMVKRHTFATTSVRVILRFSVNGTMMGETVSLATGREARTVEYFIAHNAPIEKLEIVRNNRVVETAKPHDNLAESSWKDAETFDSVALPPTPFLNRPFCFYHLRVTFADREMAWSSPVWVQRNP